MQRRYHSARTARDRDLLRQLVLQRMGWRIHRVWSTEWFHERDRSIASILRSVEQAQREPVDHPIARETLAASLGRHAKLEYLRQSAAFPGFARALGRTLQELRLSRVPPARLRQAGRSGPDLALLLEGWNGELAERGFADYAHRVELAIGEAAQARRLTGLRCSRSISMCAPRPNATCSKFSKIGRPPLST